MSLSDHPKFLMQVNRQQPVPKLISINDNSIQSPYIPTGKRQRFSKTTMRDRSLDKVNKNLNNNFYDSRQEPSLLQQQSRSQTYYPNQSQINYNTNTFTSSNGENTSIPQNHQPAQSSAYYTTMRKQLPVTQPRNYRLQVIQLQKLLEIEKQQKLELQQIIKQLTVQSQKLKQVNEHIVDRLKDLQKNFVDQKIIQQKQQDQRVRKAVTQAYQDVQNFVRLQIQNLTNKLKGQKMTPLLQKKLQLFMESMLQINQNTVQMLKMSKKRNSFVNNPLSQFITGVNNQKQNLSASNIHFNNRLSLFESKQNKNESFLSKSSNKKNSASPSSGRRLINNAYITTKNRRTSPQRQLFQTSSKNQSFPQQYSTILKQLQNNQQSFRQDFTRQSPQKIAIEHIQFRNPFHTNSFENHDRNRRNNKMGESFIEQRQYYQTSNYDESNFKIKQYTPNKRKRIFDKQHPRSRSKMHKAQYD